jgi:glutamate dehydrogenase
VPSRVSKTGASIENVVKAFIVTMHAYDLPALWTDIEKLDNKVPGTVQTAAMNSMYSVIKRAVTWLLRFEGDHIALAQEIKVFSSGIDALRKAIPQILPDATRAYLQETEDRLTEGGLPKPLAHQLAVMGLLSSASDIVHIDRKTKGDIRTIASLYFEVGEYLHFTWLRGQASSLVTTSIWRERVVGGLLDESFTHQAALTAAGGD